MNMMSQRKGTVLSYLRKAIEMIVFLDITDCRSSLLTHRIPHGFYSTFTGYSYTGPLWVSDLRSPVILAVGPSLQGGWMRCGGN